MNQVAVVYPSCNTERAQKSTNDWREKGYDVFLYLENNMPRIENANCFWGIYPGWYTACNILCGFAHRYEAIVCAGDDMEPDPGQNPNDIVADCYRKYGNTWVMQPTGDPLPGTERICGSPWLSKGWRLQGYGGQFPLPGWYMQFYGDQELKELTTKLGVLHQRKDICQRHNHWIRSDVTIKQTAYQIANGKRYWKQDEVLYRTRVKEGFPQGVLL